MHLYLHIPFCRKACHYCNFHFSTSLRAKARLLKALEREMIMRKSEYSPNRMVETVYLGGGTPSLLQADDLERIFVVLSQHYNISPQAEITLEANPDDLTSDASSKSLTKSRVVNQTLNNSERCQTIKTGFTGEKIEWLKSSPVNRLSVGIQSFREKDLRFMNRSHTANQAVNCLSQLQAAGFQQLSIDLIYGTPDMDNTAWKNNLRQTVDAGIPHISAYCLTVEPRTALAHFVNEGKVSPVNETQAAEQFEILVSFLNAHGYEHYETSNFCLPGHRSRHNSAYWQGKPYMGFGPSAHSFNGQARQWNIANNMQYIKALEKGELPAQSETLTLNDRFNEYLMTSLRTLEGCDLQKVEKDFGANYITHLRTLLPKYKTAGLLQLNGSQLLLTLRGKFLADGIISDMFVV